MNILKARKADSPAEKPDPQDIKNAFDCFRPEPESGVEYRLTVSRFGPERWLFDNMWVVAVFPTLLALLLSIMAQARGPVLTDLRECEALFAETHLEFGRRILFTSLDACLWPLDMDNVIYPVRRIYIPSAIMLFVGASVFRRFTRDVPRAFIALLEAGRLEEGPGKRTILRQHLTWQNYAASLERALMAWPRFILAALFALLAFLVLRGSSQRLAFEKLFILRLNRTTLPYFGLRIVTDILIPVLWIYFGSMGMYLLTIVAVYIRWLTPVFELKIQPAHPDGGGGLKRVADLCWQMAAMYLAFALLLSYWFQTGVFADTVQEFSTLMYIGTGVVTVLAYVTFFMPMEDIHAYMLRKRADHQDEKMRELGRIDERLRALVGLERVEAALEACAAAAASAGTSTPAAEEEAAGEAGLVKKLAKQLKGKPDEAPDQEEAKGSDDLVTKLKEERKTIEELYPDDYPIWPFNTSILVKFFTPQIIPVITLLSGLSGEKLTPVKDLIDIIATALGGGNGG